MSTVWRSTENLTYLRQLLLATESPAGAFVNLVIFLLFLAGLVDVVVALRRLRREEGHIRQARAKLPGLAAGALAGSAALLATMGVPRESLVGRRIERLFALRGAGLRHPSMLRELTGNRIAARGALARYVGAILTLVGLLGTVLGLSFALFNIQQALGRTGDLAAFKELIRALGQTLVGMRTAFACTLAGLSTALLLSSGNHAVARAQSRLAADLDELAGCDLLAALERLDPGVDQAAHAFAQLLVAAGHELERWREEVVGAAAQYGAASRELAASVDAFGRSVGELSAGQRALAEASRESGEALRALLRSSESLPPFLTDLTERHQSALDGQLRTTREAYESSLGRHREELQALVAQNRETVVDLARDQRGALIAVTDLAQDLRTQLAAASPAEVDHQTLAATLAATLAVLQELRGLAASFEPAVLQGQERSRAATEVALADTRAAVTQALTEVAERQQAELADRAQSFAAALDTALARHGEGLERNLRELLAAQVGALRTFTDLVTDLKAGGPLGGPPTLAGNGRGDLRHRALTEVRP